MNFTLKDYLPNSEQRIERLRKIVNGRPVAILAAGPSISELEDRIGELIDADICYFGLNNFSIAESKILQQIGKRFTVIICGCPAELPNRIKDILSFLNRNENNMFISTFFNNAFGLMDKGFDLDNFISKYNKKLLFLGISKERTVPDSGYPLHFIHSNTLLSLIQIAMIAKASKIILFGADGYCDENIEEYYYSHNEYNASPRECLITDTNVYFNPLAPIAVKNVIQTYRLKPIEILNCSEKSFYTSFPKISYDDCFDCFLKNRRFDRKLDLRIPKASIISPGIKNKESLKETIGSILNQSYLNYEHIILYNEPDREIWEIARQFQHIRWIFVDSGNYLELYRKGVSAARGEYLFHCCIGGGYLDCNWLNTCVEILENNPDFSSVWGLCDTDSVYNHPPQAKKFIYFWLKNKAVFPEGSFCVRKKVLEECFPFSETSILNEYQAWLNFNYKFNSLGYLPYFVPVAANYQTAGIDIENQWVKAYFSDVERLKKGLISGQITHQYRNGSGEPYPYGFSPVVFFLFDTLRCIKARFFHKAPLLFFEKAFDFWLAYRWLVFRVGAVKLWRRLINRVKSK